MDKQYCTSEEKQQILRICLFLLTNAKVFTTLEVKNSFWHIQLDENFSDLFSEISLAGSFISNITSNGNFANEI